MQTEAAGSIEEEVNALLADDARWQLVQRIVRSRTLQRASHLRKPFFLSQKALCFSPIRSYVSRTSHSECLVAKITLTRPMTPIVRVQIGHLRQKLQNYFDTEGVSESLRLTLPRGSYRTLFEEAGMAPQQLKRRLPSPRNPFLRNRLRRL